MAFRVTSLHENRFEVIAPDNFVVELIHVSLLFLTEYHLMYHLLLGYQSVRWAQKIFFLFTKKVHLLLPYHRCKSGCMLNGI